MTKPINEGGPAFPVPLNQGESYQGHAPCDGMTLRDYFAAKAMQGAMANCDVKETAMSREEWAFDVADAMIAERNKRRGE